MALIAVTPLATQVVQARATEALNLLIKAAPEMMKHAERWFEENNMTEGAICGKRKNLQSTLITKK